MNTHPTSDEIEAVVAVALKFGRAVVVAIGDADHAVAVVPDVAMLEREANDELVPLQGGTDWVIQTRPDGRQVWLAFVPRAEIGRVWS